MRAVQHNPRLVSIISEAHFLWELQESKEQGSDLGHGATFLHFWLCWEQTCGHSCSLHTSCAPQAALPRDPCHAAGGPAALTP